MRVEIRKSAAGTEYWDSLEKRTVLVPHGSKPDFEVTENPTSMIAGVDIATVKDKSVLSSFGISENGELVELSKMTIEQLKEYATSKEIELPSTIEKQDEIAKYLYENWKQDADIDLDQMNVEQLRAFAKQNNISLPFNVKKEETIRKNIEDALTASDDE